jgi:putative transcriptional regulator
MQNLTGQLLVSPPNIGDKRFATSVIYMVSHQDTGSWGLITNRPSRHTNTEIMRKLGIEINIPGYAHLGGPVNTGTVHILHRGHYINSETIFGSNGLHINCDLGFLSQLSDCKNSDEFKLVVGCCTWAPGQLEGEIMGESPWRRDQSWLTAPADTDCIFEFNEHNQWQQAIDLAAQGAVKSWMC